MERWRLGTADLLAGCDGLGLRTAWVKPGAAPPRGMAGSAGRRSVHGFDGPPEIDLDRLVVMLERWLADPRTVPDDHLLPAGPAFHRACWIAACRITPGTTMTYGDLARSAGRPAAARAAAQAMARNRLAPLVPCHRVVAANGLGGFMGTTLTERGSAWALRLKCWLLEREGIGDAEGNDRVDSPAPKGDPA